MRTGLRRFICSVVTFSPSSERTHLKHGEEKINDSNRIFFKRIINFSTQADNNKFIFRLNVYTIIHENIVWFSARARRSTDYLDKRSNTPNASCSLHAIRGVRGLLLFLYETHLARGMNFSLLSYICYHKDRSHYHSSPQAAFT